MADAATKSTALWVLKRLRSAGFEALFAGGCVRDMLLGRRCADYDVATSALPGQVRALFDRVLLIGAKFGVAMVIRGGRRVEVTTFRSDLTYSDGRRPDGVRFASAREDAERRDFTINGMFYDPPADRVVDYVGGRRDLRRRIVRTIGNPDKRFAEDHLRMIRAVRFAVALDFVLDARTAASIRRHAPKIASISGERICDEMSKMLAHRSAPRALAMLKELGLAPAVLGELFAREGLWARALGRAEAVAKRRDLTLTLAALLCELRAKAVSRIVRRWGGPNDLKDALRWLAHHLDDWRGAQDLELCEFKRLLANEHFDRLRLLWRIEEKRRTGRRASSRRIARRIGAIPADRIAPAPFVTGADLIGMGIPEGPGLGAILKRLYDAQLNEELTSRRQALAAARRMARG